MLWFHFFSLHYCSFLTDSYMPSIIIASTTECKLAKATSNQQNIISFTLPLFCKFILLIVNSLSFGNRQLFWNGSKYDLLVKETHINFMILCTYMGNGFSKKKHSIKMKTNITFRFWRVYCDTCWSYLYSVFTFDKFQTLVKNHLSYKLLGKLFK